MVHRSEVSGDTPTALLMLLLAELLGAPTIWLHVCAMLLVAAKVVHIRALVRQFGKWSGQSMSAFVTTWLVILMLALTNAYLALAALTSGEKNFTSF